MPGRREGHPVQDAAASRERVARSRMVVAPCPATPEPIIGGSGKARSVAVATPVEAMTPVAATEAVPTDSAESVTPIAAVETDCLHPGFGSHRRSGQGRDADSGECPERHEKRKSVSHGAHPEHLATRAFGADRGSRQPHTGRRPGRRRVRPYRSASGVMHRPHARAPNLHQWPEVLTCGRTPARLLIHRMPLMDIGRNLGPLVLYQPFYGVTFPARKARGSAPEPRQRLAFGNRFLSEAGSRDGPAQPCLPFRPLRECVGLSRPAAWWRSARPPRTPWPMPARGTSRWRRARRSRR